MPISLTKGSNINLSKEVPGLSKITLGLGWKPRQTSGEEFDLDASAFMVTESGKVRSDADFIFYKQKNSTCGAVQHTGDNRNGQGEGDDEKINVDLSKVPVDIQKIIFTVTIYEYATRKQNFGMVSEAYIRILDQNGGSVIARYDLSEDASTVTAMIFGELYRNNGEWKFKAVGQGFSNGLEEMARNFGVAI
jgi:tellurium resistance protein TerD